MNEAARLYVERVTRKWELAGRPKLPRGFICWHFRGVPLEERLHHALTVALPQPKGSFEYNMLEVERVFWRRFPKLRGI
jgi:hypothetical protein